MFIRTLGRSNAYNALTVQGSRAADSNQDIASLVFVNYDDDVQSSFKMAEIAVRDHYGDVSHNGFGNMIFRTNENGSNLKEHMRIDHNGNIMINTVTPVEKLTIEGNISVSNVYANTIITSNILISLPNWTSFSNIRYLTVNNLSTIHFDFNQTFASNATTITTPLPFIVGTSNIAQPLQFYKFAGSNYISGNWIQTAGYQAGYVQASSNILTFTCDTFLQGTYRIFGSYSCELL